jgi:hypothetical protein
MGLEVFERGDLPRWARVRRRLFADEVGDVAAAVTEAFATAEAGGLVLAPGARVAIGAGSRGIDRYAEVIAAAVAEVRRRGGAPFVFPAMGSHGGATAEGQLEVLRQYGITEDSVGAPVRASMETVLLGDVGGVPVFFDRIAATAADAILAVNRVKPHTDFHAPTESGILKMIAIGMGKQRGADTFHARGFDEFGTLIPAVARFALARLPIVGGLALVENGLGRLARIEAIPAARIEERERELLALARRWMGRLPGRAVDVLVIDRIGKDISGIGADSNVINRYYTGRLAFPPAIQRIVVRGLTAATEGNASGLGQADVALRRAVDAVDPAVTYMNCVTAKTPEGARMPLTVDTDRQALHVALACCVRLEPGRIRLMRIADTKHVDELWLSEALLEEVGAEEPLQVLAGPAPIAFDASGMLAD